MKFNLSEIINKILSSIWTNVSIHSKDNSSTKIELSCSSQRSDLGAGQFRSEQSLFKCCCSPKKRTVKPPTCGESVWRTSVVSTSVGRTSIVKRVRYWKLTDILALQKKVSEEYTHTATKHPSIQVYLCCARTTRRGRRCWNHLLSSGTPPN